MGKIHKFDTIWGKLQDNKNIELCFQCEIESYKEVLIELVAKDIYNLFVNDRFVSYGPARTAKGYARVERLDVSSFLQPEDKQVTGAGNVDTKKQVVGSTRTENCRNKISVYVHAVNTRTLHLAEGQPFFGIRVYGDGKLIKQTEDFTCHLVGDRMKKVERMSSQRGYLEVYDLQGNFPEVETEKVPCPKLLERRASYSKNEIQKADYVLSGTVEIDKTRIWENDFTRQLDTGERLDAYARSECHCVLSKELLSFVYTPDVAETEMPFEDKTSAIMSYKNIIGLRYLVYQLPRVCCGKFVIKLKASKRTDIWVTFDDLLKDGYVKFNREHIIHGLKWTLSEGEHTLYSQEVYSAKYIQLITDGSVEIQEVSIICIENPDVGDFVIPSHLLPDREIESLVGNSLKGFETIVTAARNSLSQNAFDIFTDCPTRERSGYICDSYFMGKAEHFFTGQNKVERDFLENYLLYDGEMLGHKGIMPMCYPSQEAAKDSYIPAWILWYVLELYDYKKRSGDDAFVELHKERMKDILEFFKGYENEYGFLENLEGWVFVEWSKASDFVDGVNIPTNILYAEVLRVAGKLLGEEHLVVRAKAMRDELRALAFDGEVYRDNAIRVDGKLTITENVSEFNQIIAAYFKMEEDGSQFYRDFVQRFQRVQREIHPAALFVGSVLRLMTLYDMGEYELVLKECKEHFLEMAEMTGTIWELFGGNASCNHGFGAVIGKVVCEAVLRLQEQKGEWYEAV